MSFQNFCNNSHFEPILRYSQDNNLFTYHAYLCKIKVHSSTIQPENPVPAWDVQIYSCPQRRIAVNMHSLIKETETMDNRPTISANCTFLQAAEITQARDYIWAIRKSEAVWAIKMRIRIWLSNCKFPLHWVLFMQLSHSGLVMVMISMHNTMMKLVTLC